MKIVYVCADPGIALYGRKGCSTHIRETVIALERLGHSVKILCANAGGDRAGEPSLDAVAIKPFQSRKLGFDLRRYLTDRRLGRQLNIIIRQWQPDAIYERYSLYARSGQRAARRFGLARLLEINAMLADQQTGRLKLPRLAQRFEDRIFRGPGQIAVTCDALGEMVARRGVASDRIHTMPMAVNVERFAPGLDGAAIRREWGLDGRFVVGFVGTLSDWHGLDMLFEAARRLERAGAVPFAFLIVGGEGPRLAQYRERCKNEGLEDRIKFIGSVPYQAVARHICAMDAAIVPDTLASGSPTKIAEYMACGVPVVAPRYPAVVEMIEDGREGYLFQIRDGDGITDCILRMMQDCEARRRMGEQARRRAQAERSWSANARAIVELFGKQIT